MTKHIIFFNTKGGVCKSTLCEYTSRYLQKLDKSVSVDNTDQQSHVTTISNNDASFCLYDTAGAFTVKNIELLKACAGVDSIIVIPIGTGLNDFKELKFLVERLTEYGLKEKSVFVFTKTRKNSKALTKKRAQLASYELNSCAWVMPTLNDFSEQLDTLRTQSEINNFLSEVVL